MVNILMIVLVTTIVTVVGGGFGYLIWLKTRPKKETWTARVWQLGSGTRQSGSDKISLHDLKPYCIDVLEKVIKKEGDYFRLVKLNKSTPAVESDAIDYWGENDREVNVLYDKAGCTLLKKGYDKVSAEVIFDPLNHDRINLIKSEVSLKKDRLHKEKDILQAISPWVVAGIMMFGLFGLAWLVISGLIEVSENNLKAAELIATGLERIANSGIGGRVNNIIDVGASVI